MSLPTPDFGPRRHQQEAGELLTPAQIEFARVVGRLLAELWSCEEATHNQQSPKPFGPQGKSH
jgi:hypothetical protein